MWPVSSAYEQVMVDGNRQDRFEASLFDKDFRPLGTPLTLAGEGGVTSEIRGEPQSRASFALLDRNRSLPPHDDGRWFSWNIGITVKTYVLGSWVEVPLFFGPVQDVAKKGIKYEIDCDSKDVQHLAPHTFKQATIFRKHTKLHQAIKLGLAERGDTKVDLDHVRQRLHSTVVGYRRNEPMKVFRQMARDANKQFYLRGDGTWKLREWPNHLAWKFTSGPDGTLTELPEERSSLGPVRDTFIVKGRRTERRPIPKKAEMDQKSLAGATSIHVENKADFLDVLEPGLKISIGGQGNNDPEVRKIAGSYTPGSRTIPLANALANAHGEGAPVSVTVKIDKEVAVIGKATLTQGHKFSAQSLTGGYRPRQEIFDRPSVHKVSRATDLAEALRDRAGGVSEQSIAVSSVPIWFLELGDLFGVDFFDTDHRSRIQRLFLPFRKGERMEINWLGERPPKGKK